MPSWTFLSRRSPALLEYQGEQSSALECGQISPPRRLSFSYFGSLRKPSAEDVTVNGSLSDLGEPPLETKRPAMKPETAINRRRGNEDVLTCTHRQLRYLFFRPHVQKLCKRCQMLLIILAEERAVYDQLLSAIEQDRGGGASSTLASQAYIEAKRIVSEEIHATIKIGTVIKRAKTNNKFIDRVESEAIVKRKVIPLKRDRKGKMPITIAGYSDKKGGRTMESSSNTTSTKIRKQNMHATSKVTKNTNRKNKSTQVLKQAKIKAEIITSGLASEMLPDVHKAGIKIRKLRRRESSELLEEKSKDSLSDDPEYRSVRQSASIAKRRHMKARRSTRHARL
ncbi:uncharacterized protein V1513DRAFT_434260 [Lipomyces chichibuensis]|uniref:uncharacterized protein n=1 Tax=Lipomyces chichibuensis TaxID=1546026 RepID=UPI003343A7FE